MMFYARSVAGLIPMIAFGVIAGCKDLPSDPVLVDRGRDSVVVTPSVVPLDAGDTVQLAAGFLDIYGVIDPGAPITRYHGSSAIGNHNNRCVYNDHKNNVFRFPVRSISKLPGNEINDARNGSAVKTPN